MYQTLIRYNVPFTSPTSLSVVHWDSSVGNAQNAITKTEALIQILRATVAIGSTLACDPEVKQINEATGQITDVLTGTAAAPAVGQASGVVLANASMTLVQWKTPTYIGGRRVQGRTFVPAPTTGIATAGEVATAHITNMTNSLTTWLGTAPGFQIWKRPVNGSGGVGVDVTAAGIWGEFATQRRRR